LKVRATQWGSSVAQYGLIPVRTSLNMATEEKIDDDEEKLVREVIAENPVEEKGERSEWSEHIGWHRKEDIFSPNDKPLLRRREKSGAVTAPLDISDGTKAHRKGDAAVVESHYHTTNITKRLLPFLVITAALGCIFLRLRRKSRKRSRYET